MSKGSEEMEPSVHYIYRYNIDPMYSLDFGFNGCDNISSNFHTLSRTSPSACSSSRRCSFYCMLLDLQKYSPNAHISNAISIRKGGQNVVDHLKLLQ